MALPLAAILAAAPYVLKGGAYLIDKYRRWRDPEGFRRAEIFKRVGITPEQYELRRQNLEQALGTLQDPQRVFLPAQAQMQQPADITAGLPQQVGAQPVAARPTGLAGLLASLGGAARSGYQEDLARIGARRGPVRNPLGRTSGQLGMMTEALRGRATGLAQDRFRLLSDYATRSAVSDIEAAGLGMQREGAQGRLQNFLAQLRRQQQAGQQEQYLGQQGLNLGEANLRNILEGERYRQGVRRFALGQQAPYTAQPAPQGV